MILPHEQVGTEWYFFYLKFQIVQVKMNLPIYSLIST